MTTSVPRFSSSDASDASGNRDRLRSAVPVLASVAVLLGVLVGGAVLLRDLLELALLLVTSG